MRRVLERSIDLRGVHSDRESVLLTDGFHHRDRSLYEKGA